VGKLRSHSQKAVSDLAKEIVKEWKAEVERVKNRGTTGPGRHPCKRRSDLLLSILHLLTTQTARKSSLAASNPPTPTTETSLKTEARTAQSDGVKINRTGDKTRDKCMELIYDALAGESGARKSLH
jgi:transcription elongation factor S-II